MRLGVNIPSQGILRYIYNFPSVFNVTEVTTTKLPVSTWPMSIKRSSEADASNLPSYENETDRIGQSRREQVRRQANSFTSHKETNASALPTAKYYKKNLCHIWSFGA